MATSGQQARQTLASVFDEIERTFIAFTLGLMTLITFANVVARYIFNSNILWALEMTVFLFAWLVLIGVSHCIKTNSHLGVDIVLQMLPSKWRKIFALFAVFCCLVFSVLLLIGAWQYWAPFAGSRSWYTVNNIPMPGFLQFLADWMDAGEAYEKVPRFIPYFALPLGMLLMTLRFLQAGWRVLKGELDMVIASHEAQEKTGSAGNKNLKSSRRTEQ